MALKEKAAVSDVAAETELKASEAQTTQVESEALETQELAVVGEKAVTVQPTQQCTVGNAIHDAQAKLRAMFGDDAIQLDFSSFPILTLQKRNFELNNGERVGDELQIIISDMKPKYLFQSAHPNEKDREVCYSYDKNADKTDPAIAAKIAAWQAEDGVGWNLKTYSEVLAVMHDDDKDGAMNGEIITVQIPPASVAKLGGYLVSQEAKGNSMGTYVTKVYPGKEVGSGPTAFFPWEFKFVKTL